MRKGLLLFTTFCLLSIIFYPTKETTGNSTGSPGMRSDSPGDGGISQSCLDCHGGTFVNPAVDIDTVPIPNWDLFEPGSIYRPMQGKIYRAVGFETQRGCPYTCTFCNSPSNNVVYKDETKKIFHRKKSIKRMKQELDFLVKKETASGKTAS